MEENTFKNLKQVAVYLRGIGCKISKTQIYEHGKARKIKPRNDGKYYLLDVEQYAKEFLKSEKAKPLNETQSRRNEAEATKLEAQAKHWQIKAKILEGSYVPRELFERELTQRAMTFKNDLDYFARAQAPEICHFINGDKDRIPDLMEYLLNKFAIFLNRYAEDREFIVPAPQDNIDINDYENEGEENNAEFLENAP